MIGVFDSGIGGLSVWKEINLLLPHVSTIYLGDQAFAPYGDRPVHEISDRGFAIARYFESHAASLIVIACNTATVNVTVNNLRQQFPHLTFVGVEPPVKPLAEKTKIGKVAVYATTATCKSKRLQHLVKTYAQSVDISITPTPEWASLVEANDLSSSHAKEMLLKYLQPHLTAGVDYAGLGCTHYPFLKPSLEQISQGKITFIDIGLPVAKQVKSLFKQVSNQTSISPTHRFITTSSDTTSLSTALKNLLHLDSQVESVTI